MSQKDSYHAISGGRIHSRRLHTEGRESGLDGSIGYVGRLYAPLCCGPFLLAFLRFGLGGHAET